MTCQSCSHLNGEFEDTNDYGTQIYESSNPEKYALNYLSPDVETYTKRVKETYLPKAEFLFSALKAQNEVPDSLNYLDVGAGAGHFVAALHAAGAANTIALEASQILVDSGNEFLAQCAHGAKLVKTSNDTLVADISRHSCDVLSMIGVIEHLPQPRQILDTFSANPRLRYLFLSVPMFSPSVCIEAAFPEVAPRHLEGGHTHLFTAQSIAWVAEHWGLTVVAEWWFGGDAVDISRAVSVKLGKCKKTEYLSKIWNNWMNTDVIDSIQAALDQKQISSELHLLLRKPTI